MKEKIVLLSRKLHNAKGEVLIALFLKDENLKAQSLNIAIGHLNEAEKLLNDLAEELWEEKQ